MSSGEHQVGGRDSTIGPWVNGRFLKLILLQLKLRPISAGVLFFGCYWGIPFAFCATYGTLLTPNTIHSIGRELLPLQIHLGVIDYVVDRLTRYQVISGANALTYLGDRTHFLFAVTLAVGVVLGVHIIERFQSAIEELQEDDIPPGSMEAVTRLYTLYRDKAYGPASIIVSATFALFATTIFLFLRLISNTDQWWGHVGYGPSGLAFSLLIGTAIYWGTRSFFIFGFGSLMLVQILKIPLTLRVYHSDGCGGLAPIGHLIVLLWAYSALAALAIYVALHFGYLGIEHTPVAWGLTGLAAIFLPMLAISPLLQARKALLEARRNALARLEVSLEEFQTELMSRIENSNTHYEAQLPLVAHTEKLFESVAEANIWPFHRQITAAIFFANILQFLLLARGVIMNSP